MRTLVIHPKDVTTDMLEIIYQERDFTVVNDTQITDKELRKLIQEHDRIIMLGHGTPQGLMRNYRGGDFERYSPYIINNSHVDLLKEKETISIWCNSDQFFRRHGLKGFHTGMIISEIIEEQIVLGYIPLNEEEIYDNMVMFATIIRDCIDMSPRQMREYVLQHYVGDDAVTQYNRKNIIVL